MDLREMPDDIIYLILDCLHIADMIRVFQAFPTFVLTHGVRELWCKRLNRSNPDFRPIKCKIRWNWVLENDYLLRKYDMFIYWRYQGDLEITDKKVVKHLDNVHHTGPTWGQSRQDSIWGTKYFRKKYGDYMMRKCYENMYKYW